MKQTLLTALFALTAVSVAAQELPPMEMPDFRRDSMETAVPLVTLQPGAENPNEMSIRIAGYELLLERNPGETPQSGHHRRKHMHGKPYGGRIGPLEVGFNGFKTNGDSYSMYPEEERGFMDLNVGRSIDITFNMFTFSTSFTRNNTIGMTMGVGLSFSNFTLETPVRFAKEDGMIRPVNPRHDLRKAKLSSFGLHVPFVLEINLTRNFFIAGGGYADLLIKSQFKSKSPKEKMRGTYTEFIQSGITARAGFRNVYIFGNYALTELFRDGKGPTVNTYTLGMGFGF